MCGIIGAVFVGNHAVLDRLPSALDLIAHRGPDGEGFWRDQTAVFGHRRLAIIDIGDGGRQPMEDRESGLVLTYNGELYNYVELRAELEGLGARFVTQSDSEVVLKALRQWGPAALARFNGMWAIALWDQRNKSLLLARDRFGVKPLYYARVGTGLAFASEAKALVHMDPRLAEPDLAALQRLVISSRAFGGAETFFKRIKSIPPACFATVSQPVTDLAPVSYWNYPEFDLGTKRASREEAQEEFRSIFESAVALRLRSDVAVGATVSGGLDSSAIVSASSRTGSHLPCYTATYGADRGEESWARICSNLAGNNLQSVDVTFSDWLAKLKKITWHMDAPGFSPPVFPLWKIFERARADRVPVLLEGQGADELFGGYVHHAAAYVWDLARQLRLIEAGRDIAGLSKTFGWPLFSKWLLRSPFDRRYTAWQAKFGRGRLLGMPAMQETPGEPNSKGFFGVLRRDHSTAILPSLLQYGDAVSMAHGIECRLPFMDYRLVEWVFRTHPELVARGETKTPVRTYLRETGFGELADRRDKKGFTTPTASWLADNAAALDDLLFRNPKAELWQFMDYAEYRRRRAAVESDFSASHTYKLLTAQLWLSNTLELAGRKVDSSSAPEKRLAVPGQEL